MTKEQIKQLEKLTKMKTLNGIVFTGNENYLIITDDGFVLFKGGSNVALKIPKKWLLEIPTIMRWK